MSEDASYELQRAIIARIKGDTAVAELIEARVFDRVPRDANGKITADFPYVSWGPEQDIPESYDCIDGSEIALQLDVWSRDPGYMEAKRIADRIKRALDNADIQLAENALVYLVYDGRNVLRDPDGVTSHVAIRFRAGVESR